MISVFKNEAIAIIWQTKNLADLESLRIKYLGKKGELTLLLKELPRLEISQRKSLGRLANEIKQAIEQAIAEQKEKILGKETKREWFDITKSGIKPVTGHLHLVSQAISEITKIFEKIGFARISYPEVEWDWYAFEGLNMAKNHPARDEWETFFIENLVHPKYGEALLTPHTSSGQLREMEKVKKPPIRMLNIAKCYRRQSDVSHAPMFYQFEGLVVNEGINITHLKGTLDYFAREYFGPQRKTRIRPFHFQFTEPSFEVDVTCDICNGRGCRLCKGGWLELGGAGMVHPTVLKNGGIDPQKYTGFAFGWGVERVLMMKAGLKLPDLRILYNNDLRFLEQF
ncbi:phenylalanine--tRNA ligase subunit alpha [Candidatus Gottesmanbacteria bacterium]|nr:phenylalanine--tRNA ligase subunit alpha [Candidatus Gottesmanbacteria bacterium]